MDLELTGKRAIVTASSRGLGYACAQSLAAEGAQVVVASRSLEKAQAAATQLQNVAAGDIFSHAVDVARSESLRDFFTAATHDLGGLDVLVCNAGGPPAGGFCDLSEEAWDGAYQLTLQSVVRSVRLALPHFQEAGGGVILVITSSSVVTPIPNLTLSNVFRPAVRALCKSLALELASLNIRVLNIAPGRIDTDRIAELDNARAQAEGLDIDTVRQASLTNIPQRRLGTPKEFGDVVAFLASNKAGYVTGSTIFVDGGAVQCL